MLIKDTTLVKVKPAIDIINGSCIVPDIVTCIGSSAFRNCTGLTKVVIPNSVRLIRGFAFNNCTGLTEVVIPSSVTHIGDCAFEHCTGLTKVEIPNSVRHIGDFAFNNCRGLTEVVIPNSVTHIGDSAFRNCRGLTKVEIPSSVTHIGESAFYNCTRLTSIIIVGQDTPKVNYQECIPYLDWSKITIERSEISRTKSARTSKNLDRTLPPIAETTLPDTFVENDSIEENTAASFCLPLNLSIMLLGGFIAIAGIAAIILAFLAFSPGALAVSIGLGSAGILGGIGLFAIPAYRVVKENACRVESLYSVN